MKLTIKQKKSLDGLRRSLDATHSAFCAAKHFRGLLLEAGFQDYTHKLPEKLETGAKGFFVKNDSAVLAFVVGKDKNGPFRLIGAHTDSPTLRIKPQPFIKKEGCLLLNAEVYGGPILNSWFDRPLSLAGRVVCKKGAQLESLQVDLRKPLLLLPNLAIHMNRQVNDGVKVEKQKQLLPVLTLFADKKEEDAWPNDKLEELLAEAAGVDKKDILDWDLTVYDCQEAVLGGLNDEWINSPRLDNIGMVHAGLTALIQAKKLPQTSFVFAADNEEVGSRSKQGAASLYLRDQMERVFLACGGSHAGFLAALDESFLVSADQAHAVHPYFSEVADPTNRPHINRGPVIKLAANCSYTSDAYSSAVFRLCCEEAGVPCQNFVNHSDRPGGSTIGPLTTAFLHCAAVDVGNALWGMHSARETGGVLDGYYMEQALQRFLERPTL